MHSTFFVKKTTPNYKFTKTNRPRLTSRPVKAIHILITVYSTVTDFAKFLG
ncbi:hypothetical protein ZORO111903_02320 [Zobellia roscoffensis]